MTKRTKAAWLLGIAASLFAYAVGKLEMAALIRHGLGSIGETGAVVAFGISFMLAWAGVYVLVAGR